MEINLTKKKPIIYLGPSMPFKEAMKILDAHYLPPIKRGDLAKLDPNFISHICIIDGVFYGNYSISPFEILETLHKNIKIFGTASMGALKAIECEKFGMVGVGTIFNWYKLKKIDAEDEVAVTFDPKTYKALSVPLVNIRYLLSVAFENKVITLNEKRVLFNIAKNTYFPERSYFSLFQSAVKKGLSQVKINKLRKMSLSIKYDLKFKDTKDCLNKLFNNINDL